jgi:hypothetical protein
VKWSAHFNTGNYDGTADGAQETITQTYRFLHKTYKVWVSANYVSPQEHVSVTPVSPYPQLPSVDNFCSY